MKSQFPTRETRVDSGSGAHSSVPPTPPTMTRKHSLLVHAAFAAATLVVASSVFAAQDSARVAKADTRAGAVPLADNLGTLHRTVQTSSPLAQRYFDQGLRLYYAFNHAEAVRNFREAQRLDPNCAMCVWGEAAALGPNINAPMDTAAERVAVAATQRGLGLLRTGKVKPGEEPFLRAIELRYLGTKAATRAGRDTAYAAAMATIAERSPGDVDALALAAEAQMDLAPWVYWTSEGTARPGTEQALAWLERGMKLAPEHPGACHFYIHAVEAVHPTRAVACAERLASLMPGAGHIVHMPAHIYIRVGRWADAIESNKHAVHADQQYFDGPHSPDYKFYQAAYGSHNHHFLTMAAVMAGASATAIESSHAVLGIITPDVARAVPPVEPMLAIPVQTLVTFGRWEDVLDTPMPPSDLRLASGHFWYARGVAFAATGRRAEAMAAIDSIRAVAEGMPEGQPRMTLDIAALAVEGEVALRNDDAPAAVTAFTRAAEIEDRIAYMEPPTWYYPIRQSLGMALLAAGRPGDAERVYLEDLERFPENGWSLTGLAQALRAQERADEAAAVDARLAKAWRLADVKPTASRF